MPETPAEPRRSASAWITLLAVWFIGLIVWGLYLTLIIYLVIRMI